MWIIIFLLCLGAIGNSFGETIFSHCNLEKCEKSELRREFRAIKQLPPSEEELKRICPHLLEAMECSFSSIIECTGHSLSVLSASNNDSISEFSRSLITAGGLIVEVCDEDAQLHRDYVENVECFRAVVEDNKVGYNCYNEFLEAYLAFREAFPFPEDGDLEEEELPEDRCLRTAYQMACMATHLQKSCSEGAKRALMEFVSRLGVALANPCSAVTRQVLKGEFLEFLNNMEGMNIQGYEYSSLFNLFRK